MKNFKELREKKLTPAEKKKREEIAKAIEKDDPKMPMDKKMAIATATAKRVAEYGGPKISKAEYLKKGREYHAEGYKSPAEAQAIADGKKAARQGKKYSDNPHKKGSKEFTAWSKGHNMARESVEENKKSHPQGSAKFYRGAMDKYKAKTPKKSHWDMYMDKHSSKNKKEDVDEAYYRGQRKATPKKQEPPKMGSKSGSGYDLYHKSYSAALQHAYAWAKKKGYEVDMDDVDRQVAMGPKKPSDGKTNSFTLKLKNNPKKKLAVQVYGMGGGKYELNTYIT